MPLSGGQTPSRSLESRLARAARTDDGCVLAERDVEGEILEDALSLTVREGNILRFKEWRAVRQGGLA